MLAFLTFLLGINDSGVGCGVLLSWPKFFPHHQSAVNFFHGQYHTYAAAGWRANYRLITFQRGGVDNAKLLLSRRPGGVDNLFLIWHIFRGDN